MLQMETSTIKAWMLKTSNHPSAVKTMFLAFINNVYQNTKPEKKLNSISKGLHFSSKEKRIGQRSLYNR